jgi:UDP-glucose 4-epimerase
VSASSFEALADRGVLVTGGLGFIGSNLVHELVRLGARVTVLDSLDPDSGGDRANLAGIEDRVSVLIGDIRSGQSASLAMDGVDLVVNCAAFTSHAKSMAEPIRTLDVNVGGVITLLDAIRSTRRSIRFVQLGTTTQVGRMSSEPVTEDHPEQPLDLYSASKTGAEKVALIQGAAARIPVVVLRLPNVYGPRAKLTDPALGFMNWFIGLALEDRELTVYGGGEQRRTVLYSSDAVRAVILASVMDAAVGEVFMVGADRPHTVREIAEAIVRAVGRGRVRTVPWPPDRARIDVGDAVIGHAKITTILGWRPVVGLEEGLRLTRNHFVGRSARVHAET